MECSTISNNISTGNVTFDVQSQQIEVLQQQLHEVNQQFESANLLKNEMELEIEKLQSTIDFNENVVKLERAEVARQFNEKINSLQCLLEEEREQARNEIAELKNKLEAAKLDQKTEVVPIEHEVLQDQLLTLKDEIKELKDQLAESKNIIYTNELANAQLLTTTKELEEELKVSKDILKTKTELLQSTVEAFEEMKGEKALLSNELAILKAGPLENNDRGNSLFSEVDIKRQVIEKKMDLLRSKYLQAKKVLALKNNEMEKLKAENRKIQMFWDEEVSNVKLREQKLLESYKRTNDELRCLIHKLELRPETPEIVTISDKDMSNMQWIHTVIEKARTEARDLRKAYENKSCEMLLVEENLYSMSMEIKNLKKQAIKDKARIDELESKIAALENPNNTINPEEQRADPSNKDTLKEQEKKFMSNGVQSLKTVRFAEDFKSDLLSK